MSTSHHNSNSAPYVSDSSSTGEAAGGSRVVTYWRVEGSLLELGALRPVLFFTWNSRSYAERWARRAGMAGMALSRPFAYAANRTFATRFLHTLLRGVSQDRLDLLGEEYFQYVLKPQLRRDAAEKLLEAVRSGQQVVLVGQLLDHIVRPLANHFGIESFLSNRLEFRDGHATGRLLDPVVRPRGPFAWLASGSSDGHIDPKKLLAQLDWKKNPQYLETARQLVERPTPPGHRSVELLPSTPRLERLAVRETLAG